MILYTLTYDCLDYYCDGMHLIGAFENEDKAIEIRDRLKAGWRPDDFFVDYNWSSFDYSVAPLTVDKVYDGL
jgi:hypothetical protein